MRAGNYGTRGPLGRGLRARRITQNHIHHIRTSRNEVIARGHVSQYDTLHTATAPEICTIINVVADGDSTGIRSCDVGQTCIPLIGSTAQTVQLQLITLQLYHLSGSNILATHRHILIIDRLLVGKGIVDGNNNIRQRYMENNRSLIVAVHIFLIGLDIKDIGFVHLEHSATIFVYRLTRIVQRVDIIYNELTLLVLQRVAADTEGTILVVLLYNIERRSTVISLFQNSVIGI